MRTRLLGLWLAAALFGFVTGIAGVDLAHATTTYTIEVMGGGTSYMTCGWHGSCASGSETSGVAIDRGAYANHAFYFRSFMYRSSGAQGTVAKGTVEVPTGETCKTVRVNIGSPYGVTYRGSIIYLHVSSTAGGNTIDIVASTSGYWTQSQVGSTVTSDNPGCPWEGEHLHQRVYWENAVGSRNTGEYPGYVNAGYHAIDVQGYHQDSAYWSY